MSQCNYQYLNGAQWSQVYSMFSCHWIWQHSTVCCRKVLRNWACIYTEVLNPEINRLALLIGLWLKTLAACIEEWLIVDISCTRRNPAIIDKHIKHMSLSIHKRCMEWHNRLLYKDMKLPFIKHHLPVIRKLIRFVK